MCARLIERVATHLRSASGLGDAMTQSRSMGSTLEAASCHAITPPQSCPTSTMVWASRVAIAAAMADSTSDTQPLSRDTLDPPKPGKSRATDL